MDPLSPSRSCAVLARGPSNSPFMQPAAREDFRAGRAGTWLTRSGAAVLIRPIDAADLPLLREFVQALSPETKYKRYLSPRTPADEEMRRWAAIDPSHEYSLVAVDHDGGDELLGEARYVSESAGEAEIAIVIGDRWQGHGLGRELITRLISAARCNGLLRLTGLALSTNKAVLTLAKKLGFRLSKTAGAGWVTTLSLDLRS